MRPIGITTSPGTGPVSVRGNDDLNGMDGNDVADGLGGVDTARVAPGYDRSLNNECATEFDGQEAIALAA